MTNANEREGDWLTLLANVTMALLVYLLLGAVNERIHFIDQLILSCVFVGIISGLPLISICWWAAKRVNTMFPIKQAWKAYCVFTLSAVYLVLGLFNLILKFTKIEYLQVWYVALLAALLVATRLIPLFKSKK